jgi:hypothetical protein
MRRRPRSTPYIYDAVNMYVHKCTSIYTYRYVYIHAFMYTCINTTQEELGRRIGDRGQRVLQPQSQRPVHPRWHPAEALLLAHPGSGAELWECWRR